MRFSSRRFILLSSILLAGVAAWPAALAAQEPSGGVPRFVTFTGTLPGASADTAVTLSLYADANAAAPLWSETQVVAVDAQGRYKVRLGASRPDGLPLDLFVAGQARWLGVQPAGGDEQPRVMLVAVPYALKAADAASLDGRPLSAFLLAGDRTGVGADGLTYVDTRVLKIGLGGAGPLPQGAGTANYLGMFQDASTLVNSAIYQGVPPTGGTGIGIGTTAPQAAFHSVAAAAPGALFDVYSNALTALPVVYRAARGTPAAPTAVQTDDILGGLAVRGYGATAFTSGRGQVMFKAAENWTDTANGTYLQFTTTPLGSGAWTERVRITPDGNVGIGTSRPAQRLSVAGTIESSSGGFRFPDGTVQTTAALGTVGSAGSFLRSNGAAWLASAILPDDVPTIPASRVSGTAAVLTGGNQLTGNQTVTGTVQATAFVGDGSGLTNVATAQIAALQAQVAALQKLVDQAVPAGSVIWAKGWASTADDAGFGAAADKSGNLYVTGAFAGSVNVGGATLTSAGDRDIFLVKLAPDGTHLWSKRFGGTGLDSGRGVAVDSAGNVLLVGYFQNSIDFGGGSLTSAGGSDICLAKFTSDGNYVWSRRFGGAASEYGFAVAVGSHDSVVLTGSLASDVDFGGGVLYGQADDVFVARFTSAGVYAWARRCVGTLYDYGRAVAVASDDGVIVGGTFQGSVDFLGHVIVSAGGSDAFVLKLAYDGTFAWVRRFGSTGTDGIAGVAADGSDNVVVAGSFNGSVDFGGGALASSGSTDAFVAEFTAAGTHVWSKRFGSTGDDQAGPVVVDGQDNVVTAGFFNNAVDFGGGALTSAGGADIFLLKLAPDSTHLWSRRFGSAGVDYGYALAVDEAGFVSLAGNVITTASFAGVPVMGGGGPGIVAARVQR